MWSIGMHRYCTKPLRYLTSNSTSFDPLIRFITQYISLPSINRSTWIILIETSRSRWVQFLAIPLPYYSVSIWYFEPLNIPWDVSTHFAEVPPLTRNPRFIRVSLYQSPCEVSRLISWIITIVWFSNNKLASLTGINIYYIRQVVLISSNYFVLTRARDTSQW